MNKSRVVADEVLPWITIKNGKTLSELRFSAARNALSQSMNTMPWALVVPLRPGSAGCLPSVLTAALAKSCRPSSQQQRTDFYLLLLGALWTSHRKQCLHISRR